MMLDQHRLQEAVIDFFPAVIEKCFEVDCRCMRMQ